MDEHIFEKLQGLNPDIKLFHIEDDLFKQYGKVLDYNGFSEVMKYLDQHTIIPQEGNNYVAHDNSFLASLSDTSSFDEVFNGIELEYGYVNGNNNTLNAVEYHNSSEINISCTSMIILLGKYEDIIDRKYKTKKLISFYVPKGTAIQFYPKVLHFSPFKINSLGFKCGVILPFGTNMELSNAVDVIAEENFCLFKTNKWLLAHEENIKAISNGAYVGLIGKNTIIKHI